MSIKLANRYHYIHLIRRIEINRTYRVAKRNGLLNKSWSNWQVMILADLGFCATWSNCGTLYIFENICKSFFTLWSSQNYSSSGYNYQFLLRQSHIFMSLKLEHFHAGFHLWGEAKFQKIPLKTIIVSQAHQIRAVLFFFHIRVSFVLNWLIWQWPKFENLLGIWIFGCFRYVLFVAQTFLQCPNGAR
jgi:hypothetical protein